MSNAVVVDVIVVVVVVVVVAVVIAHENSFSKGMTTYITVYYGSFSAENNFVNHSRITL